MADISGSIYKMRFLDEQSVKQTAIHGIHPLSKLLVTIVFIIITASYGKYAVPGMLPLVLYPVLLISLADIPAVPLLKRVLPAIPFVVGVGIFNPLFERAVFGYFFGIPFTRGWISFAVLIIKCILLVLAALILIATTGMDGIAAALRLMHVPRIFTLQLLLTYRYISVLADEAGRMWNAYSLRAPGQKGVNIHAWGPLAGQLILRTFDRAQRVYSAMVLRGFRGEYHSGGERAPAGKDVFYFLLWTAYMLLVRFFDIPHIIGTIVTGGVI